MTEFQNNTEKLRAQLESGDIAKICEKADCTQSTLFNAWKRTDATEFTPKERAAYETFVSFVEKKIAAKQKLNQRVADVAANLPK